MIPLRSGALQWGGPYLPGEYPNEATLVLPVTEDPLAPPAQGLLATGYVLTVRPGRDGAPGLNRLERNEDPVELAVTGIVHDAEWKTAPLTVRIVDQNGVPIPASQWGGPYLPGEYPNEATLVLPVTEDPLAPPAQGLLATGYVLTVRPGRDGAPGLNRLERNEDPVELAVTGIVHDAEWKTAPLTVRIVDQNGVPIPASQWGGPYLPGEYPNEATLVLPVTEDPLAPPAQGQLAVGYALTSKPGLNGMSGTSYHLFRAEEPQELTSAGLVKNLEWETSSGELRVVDVIEHEVLGSFFEIASIPLSPSGSLISLPVNDLTVYPTMGGVYAGGYGDCRIRVASGLHSVAPSISRFAPEGS